MKYPTTVYRVSLKAAIFNTNNEILLIDEYGGGLKLPGGGLDHFEQIKNALQRELQEEVDENVQINSISDNPVFVFDAYPEDIPKLTLVYDVSVNVDIKANKKANFYKVNQDTLRKMEDAEKGYIEHLLNHA